MKSFIVGYVDIHKAMGEYMSISCSAGATVTKCSKLGPYKQQRLISLLLLASLLEARRLRSWGGSSSWLQTANPSQGRRQRKAAKSVSLLIRTLMPFKRATPSRPNYLPEASSSPSPPIPSHPESQNVNISKLWGEKCIPLQRDDQDYDTSGQRQRFQVDQST